LSIFLGLNTLRRPFAVLGIFIVFRHGTVAAPTRYQTFFFDIRSAALHFIFPLKNKL
jgi:hypothetical protein